MNVKIQCSLSAGLVLASIIVMPGAQAQLPSGYPNKTIRIIAPTPPGSPPDIVARILADRLAVAFGQPVVVENRPGAIGTIGLHMVSRAAPDGYTFGALSMAAVVAPSLLPQVPYDTVSDLAPVSQVAWGAHILVVRASSPLKSVDELIAFAKARPGQITFASGGNGTPAHLAGEFFRLRADVDIRHVPFKGALAGIAAVLGEQVDIMFAATPAAAPHIKSGKLRAFATTAPHRLPAFPDLPAMAELGFPGFDVREWHGLVAPAGTPREIVAKMAAEIAKLTYSPEMKERFASLGMEAAGQAGPEAFGALIRSELTRWAGVAREAGIRAD